MSFKQGKQLVIRKSKIVNKKGKVTPKESSADHAMDSAKESNTAHELHDQTRVSQQAPSQVDAKVAAPHAAKAKATSKTLKTTAKDKEEASASTDVKQDVKEEAKDNGKDIGNEHHDHLDHEAHEANLDNDSIVINAVNEGSSDDSSTDTSVDSPGTAKSLKALMKSGQAPTSDKAKKALKALEALIALKDPASESLEKPEKPVSTPKIDSNLESNLAAQPPRSINSPIRIFQIYFEAWQRELLDPAFYPLDNSRGTSELMEFAVFEQLQKNAATQGASLWGALSWRFGEKTGMVGNDWVKQITDNPGFDVYFCNPYPANEGVYHNMWLQGEVSHPAFIEICKAFFVAAGLDDKELTSIHSSNNFSAANYFVASPKFWELFIPYVKRVLVAADKKMNPQIRDILHSKVADDKGIHAGATYVPFIVERLFPTFMHTEGKDLKGFKITLPERERELNVHLKLLREMKDVAHRTQSAWLAACWVNYRNLYLSQTNSKAWCEKYLRPITPTEVRFL